MVQMPKYAEGQMTGAFCEQLCTSSAKHMSSSIKLHRGSMCRQVTEVRVCVVSTAKAKAPSHVELAFQTKWFRELWKRLTNYTASMQYRDISYLCRWVSSFSKSYFSRQLKYSCKNSLTEHLACSADTVAVTSAVFIIILKRYWSSKI